MSDIARYSYYILSHRSFKRQPHLITNKYEYYFFVTNRLCLFKGCIIEI